MLSLALVVVIGGLWVVLRGIPTLSSQLSFAARTLAASTHAPDNTANAGNVNVVIFIIDTLRADRLNTYGYDRKTTSPHIDALAKNGVVFPNTITAATWTRPRPGTPAAASWPCN